MNDKPDKPSRKIAHLIHADGTGGGPKSLAAQVSYFRERFETVLLHGGHGTAVEFCESAGIPHVRLPIDRLYKLFWGFFALCIALRRTRPDLLILHGQWAGFLGSLAGRLTGIRHIIYIARWPAFYTDWDWWRVNRNFLCEWMPCRLSDKIVTVSESSRYQYLFRGWAKEERLLTIPNSVDPATVPDDARASQIRRDNDWATESCHVVFVGRLVNEKRVDWLLKSWAVVTRECPSARLWIVGDGEERQKLQSLATRLSLDETCTFMGTRPGGIDYIAAADVVVITSMYEAHANVPLESMACSRPIVATRVDGIRDSFDGGEGFLVPPGDTELFARRIIELVGNPALRAQMGAVGKETVARFNSKNILSRYETLYLNMLTEATCPGPKKPRVDENR